MKRKELNCLLISSREEIQSDLASYLQFKEIYPTLKLVQQDQLKQHLKGKAIDLIFIDNDDETGFKKHSLNVIHALSKSSLIVFLTQYKASQPITWHSSGLELCVLSTNDLINQNPVVKNILAYAHLKKHFRQCKILLNVSEKRSHWLMNSSNEAIAYIYHNQHIQANPAYLNSIGVSHLSHLSNITVQQIIDPEDWQVFLAFYRQHHRNTQQNQVLHLNMRKANGEKFLATIRLLPAVRAGIRCNQLWIKPIEKKTLQHNQTTLTDPNTTTTAWDGPSNLHSNRAIEKDQKTGDDIKNNLVNRSLRDLIKIAKPQITLLPIDARHDTHNNVYYVDLALPEEPVSAINELLSQSSVDKRIFWDRILFTLFQRQVIDEDEILEALLEELSHQTSDTDFLLTIDPISLLDEEFLLWLTDKIHNTPLFNQSPTLKPVIALAMPDVIAVKSHIQPSIDKLKALNIPLAITEFVYNESSNQIINQLQPSYVWLSDAWLNAVILNPTSLAELQQKNALLNTLHVKSIATAVKDYQTMEAMEIDYIYHPLDQ